MSYAGVGCFWADRLEIARVALRRYRSGDPCPGPWGYHNSESVPIDRTPIVWRGEAWSRGWHIDYPEPAHDDQRWPRKCADCDYRFVEEDHWQVFSDLLYRRLDTGRELILAGPSGSRGSGPPGMLFEMDWYPNSRPNAADGITLGAVCPNGAIWCVDGPASRQTVPCWTRTGEARSLSPSVTANPSIVAADYHGFLRQGAFSAG